MAPHASQAAQAANVQVAVRCRPMSSKEEAMGCHSCIDIQGSTVVLTPPPSDESSIVGEPKSFTYDHAFGNESTQAGVYMQIGEPLVGRALEGYNVTIFAYGQTGSGKTHTMMGLGGENAGVIPLLNRDLFKSVSTMTTEETKFMVTVSYLEIYNEVIHDLLNPVKDQNLKIREHPELGIYVDGLCELVVKTSDDVMLLLDQGAAVRRVAATNMNERSSRSHSCFTIKLAQKTTLALEGGVTRETLLNSKLNLVDLAGSERAKKTGATGSVMKEGVMINKSLLCLGIVITALSETKRGHIPYRDSTLTRLLQESLGGNAQTLMMAAISPADYNAEETLSTLRYAHRAKSIQNSVSRNEDVNEKMIRELKEEIEKLRAQLISGPGAGKLSAADVTDTELVQRMAALEAAQKDTWQEKEKLSQQLELERANNVTVAVGQAVDLVKQSKMETMKNIKRLQAQKEATAKRQKSLKSQHDRLKEGLQGGMGAYQTLQAEYDQTPEGHPARAEMESRLAQLLEGIETEREELVACRSELERLKKESKRLDGRLVEERAELVASSGLLEQNQKLRSAIAQEERTKFEAEKESYLENALSEEKRRIEEQALSMEKSIDEVRASAFEKEAELTRQIKNLQKECAEREAQQSALQQEVEELTNQLADTEVSLEASQSEVYDLKTLYTKTVESHKREIDAYATQLLAHTSQTNGNVTENIPNTHEHEHTHMNGTTHHEDKEKKSSGESNADGEYKVFKGLLDLFEVERRSWEHRIGQFSTLLSSALQDVVFLQKRNEELETQLEQAATWDAP